MDKYEITLEDEDSKEVYSAYLYRLKNKLYGVLCEREKSGEWEKFLDSIMIELMNFPKENKVINYYTLFTKMATLRYLSYPYFRSTIFECMNLFDFLDGSYGSKT